MYLSFRGMTKNTINELKDLKRDIEEAREELEKQDITYLFADENIDMIITNVEAYHDIVVALIKGDTTIEEARKFLCFDDEPPRDYFETLLTIKKKN